MVVRREEEIPKEADAPIWIQTLRRTVQWTSLSAAFFLIFFTSEWPRTWLNNAKKIVSVFIAFCSGRIDSDLGYQELL